MWKYHDCSLHQFIQKDHDFISGSEKTLSDFSVEKKGVDDTITSER